MGWALFLFPQKIDVYFSFFILKIDSKTLPWLALPLVNSPNCLRNRTNYWQS